MFTAVLQLHGIAPKFPTIARGYPSVSRSHKRPLFPSNSLGDSSPSGYLRRASFYSALIRLSCSQIRRRPCLFLHLRESPIFISVWYFARYFAVNTRAVIRYRAPRALNRLDMLERSRYWEFYRDQLYSRRAIPRTIRTTNPEIVRFSKIRPALNSSTYF